MDNDKNLQPVNLQLIQANYEENEISLYDIWRLLFNYKYHIASITFVCTVIAIFYALHLSPVYQAKAYLLPPNERDVASLNIDGNLISSDQAYREYINTFNSRAIRLLFFNQNKLIDKLVTDVEAGKFNNEVFENNFHKLLTLEDSIAKLSSNEAEFAAEWLNKYVDFVNRVTVESLSKNVEKKIITKRTEIVLKINNLRVTAEKRKEDKIAELSEALMIAKKVELEQKSNISVSNIGLENEKSISLLPVKQQQTIYDRGVIALSAELQSLEGRKNLDSYIPNLRELEEEIRILSGLMAWLQDDSSVKAIIVDQKAMIPNQRIKPKRKQIVIWGLVSGLIIGILISFTLNLIRNMGENVE